MIALPTLKGKLVDTAQKLLTIEPPQESCSTLAQLCQVATASKFDDWSQESLDFFSKKFDISQKLHAQYDAKGRKVGAAVLSSGGQQLFLALLYFRVLWAQEQSVTERLFAKYLNVCWKAWTTIENADWLAQLDIGKTLTQVQNQWLGHLPDQTLKTQAVAAQSPLQQGLAKSTSLQTLPMDVLFYEGPIARAYLAILSASGYKPRRIIQLIASRDLVSKKPVGTFLPTFLRQRYAASIQSRKIHHWSKYFFRNQKSLCEQLFTQIELAFQIDREAQDGLLKLKPLTDYAEEVIPLSFQSLKDQTLIDFLKTQTSSLYLFTGGGIVPPSFFELEHTRFLHIHPGHLPEIRGADCLLWSTLLSGHPSATCFYMNAGIDTGDVIHSTFLPQIHLPAAAAQLDDKMIYRLLYCFVDPWVRAVVLREAVEVTACFTTINASPQTAAAGTTFHFMHPRLKHTVLRKNLVLHSE